jgi:hypothetical protein
MCLSAESKGVLKMPTTCRTTRTISAANAWDKAVDYAGQAGLNTDGLRPA